MAETHILFHFLSFYCIPKASYPIFLKGVYPALALEIKDRNQKSNEGKHFCILK